MSSTNPSISYAKELRKNFKYLATWTPGNEFSLGDIGIIKRGLFTRISSIHELGIKFKTRKDTTKEDLNYSSSGSVSVTTKIAGAISPPNSSLAVGDAGISVDFSKEKSILFKMKGVLTHSISDQISLGNQLIKLFQEGKWDKQWSVITELLVAESGTVLISGSNSGKVDLKADAKATAADLDIANASLNFALSFSKDMSTQIVATEGLSPLFKASKVKRKWLFRKSEFVTMGIAPIDLIAQTEIPENELYFDEVNDDDLDDLESIE